VALLAQKDLRRGMPRFEPTAYSANLKLLPTYAGLAQQAGCTPAQLAWPGCWRGRAGGRPARHHGRSAPAREPGRCRAAPGAGLVAAVDALINRHTVYAARATARRRQADVDTEDFAPPA
jgi:hypothetical protein